MPKSLQVSRLYIGTMCHFNHKSTMTMRQAYEAYTAEDLEVWQRLFDRQTAQLPGLAAEDFLSAVQTIEFGRDRIPNFDEMNVILGRTTGWGLVVVPGLIANKEFFELLEDKKFPATTWFRRLSQLDYLEEPDMFHDVYGHVPLLTHPDFCGFLSGLSRVALQYIDNEWAIELISRLYWYTVEFGLIEDEKGLRIYGAGILSSSGESVYSVGPEPVRVPYDIRTIFRTPYIKDRYQEKYFVISSYRQLFDSVGEMEGILAEELDMVAV